MNPGTATVTAALAPAGTVLDAPALVAISHGTSSPQGQRAVAGLVEAVARASVVPVVPGHVDVEQPDVAAALATLPPDRAAVIVPLLLSAGYHVHVDLVEEAADADHHVEIARALGPDDRIVALLARRLAEAGLASGDAVVLGCAGSSDLRAVADCFEMARRLGAVLDRPVSVGFISAAEPRLPEAVSVARAEHPQARVLVSTYLLAPGYFNDLAHAMAADAVTDPLLVTDAAAPGELVDVVLDRYGEVARRPLIGHSGA